MELTIGLKVHEAKTMKIDGKNRQFNYNSQRVQYSTFNNAQNNKAEDQQENSKT